MAQPRLGSSMLLALLCACASPGGRGGRRKAEKPPVSPALAGLDSGGSSAQGPEVRAPAAGRTGQNPSPAPKESPEPSPTAAFAQAAPRQNAPATPSRRGAGGSAQRPAGTVAPQAKADERDLPSLSSAKGGQIDKLMEDRLDVTAYRVQISKTNEFEKPIFDKTFDAMKPIDLFAEFQDAGVEVDQNAYWVRIALIDVLAHEEKFTAPRLYGLDKKRQDE